ncbi:hypothetical protein HYU40_04745 [Candidatus Woesearchaeota archaeon]|nr:hypothetical protein [Candidatus Woesearchaeota archaeon]
MTTKAYPLRIDENVFPIIEFKAREDYVDKSTAARQLLYQGVEDYVLKLYGEGRISLGKAAEALNKSVHDVLMLAQKRKAKASHTEQAYETSRRTAERLKK